MIAFGLVLSLLFLGRGGQNATVKNPGVKEILHEFNPTRILTLMRYPNLLLTDIAAGFLAFSQYAMLATPRHIFVKEYNITSPLTSGLFFLAPAAGFLVGTLIGGRFSDKTVRKWIVLRNGLRLPQDRLRSGYAFWFFLIPVPMLLFGWCIDQHVGGLPLACVTAFFASVGMLGAFAGVNTYCAEVFPQNRQEAIATKYVIQYILSAAASGVAVPMIDAVGVGLQTTIGVVLVLAGGVMCVGTAWYGHDMQTWVDKRWPAASRIPLEKAEDMYGGAALQHTMSAP
jgi:MFS family permease